MNRNLALGLLSIGVLVGSTPAVMAVQKGGAFQSTSPKVQVGDLFASMRQGKYSSIEFPKLTWQDIPELLKLGTSKAVLTSFPRNSLSSQMQAECTEGMMALWLIEGVRRSGQDTFMHFPSLNPLIGKLSQGDWQKQSESHHSSALEAYRSWWKRVESMPKEKAARIDPLHGTGMTWYGAGL